MGNSHPNVFLSHNHKDKSFVRKLAESLRTHGVKIWLDEAEINVGDSLIQKISEGIRGMDYLAVVLSPNSVNSSWVQKELEISMNLEIEGKRVRVLPILLKDCEMPLFLKGKFYADFRNSTQYTDSVNLFLRTLNITPSGINEESFTIESLRDYVQRRYPLNGPYDDWGSFPELLSQLEFIGINTPKELEALLQKALPGLIEFGRRSLAHRLLSIHGTGIIRVAMWMVDEKAASRSIASRQTYKKYHKYII